MSKHPIENSIAILQSDAVAQICAPLKDYLQITHFNYRRTYADGTRALLTNDPRWLVHYYQRGYANQQTFETNIEQFQTGHTLWKTLANQPNFGQIFVEARLYFDIDQGITLIKKQKDYVEFFHFGMNKDNSAYIERNWQQIDLLEKFIHYFRDKGAELIQQAIAQPLLSAVKPTLEEPITINALNNLLNNTSLRYLYQGSIAVILSRQETIILFFYFRGHTIKKIAELTHLSTRTIEEYIGNIKKKTSSLDKHQLLKKYNQFMLVDIRPIAKRHLKNTRRITLYF